MTALRRLHLGAFMRPATIHTGAWRSPGAYPDANFNFEHLKAFAQKLEAAKFDAFFMADHLAVLDQPPAALRRSHTATSFEPLTLLSALASVTQRIGLVATASTTFDAPYHVARRFASLDHISNGRAGWNIVTTASSSAALNFGYDSQMDHGARYVRAREFYDVVTGLWDSFADDAFVRDVGTGVYFDPSRMRVLDHKGPSLSVRGPLNIAGRQLAAETADAVFASESTLDGARRFYADVKARANAAGRDPAALKILPAVFVVVGETVEDAQAKRASLDSLVHYDSGIATLNSLLSYDVSGYDPEGPLPDIPETNASKSARASIIELARRENLCIRELAQKAGSYSGLAFVGTARAIADEMEAWLVTDACDGFIVMFSSLPEGLDAFAGQVVPELQRRGLFRTEYEGVTLRENLGLPRPANRHFGND